MADGAAAFDAWLGTDKPPTPPPRGTNLVLPAGGDGTPYGRAALEGECGELANTVEGSRNDRLNTAAFKLASLCDAGHLPREGTIANLRAAALSCGLEPGEIEATIKSAFAGSAAKVGARVVPEREEIPPAYVLDHLAPRTQNIASEPGDENSEAEAVDYLQRAVQQRALQIRIDDEARELYSDWQASALGQEMPDIVTLNNFLAVPDEDAQYRIADLWPTGGNVLLAAQYKAGKTSMIANLLRALADGDPFLGRFKTQRPTRITLFDDELDERMLRRWLRDQGIQNECSIAVAPMKGRLATFNILNARARARWAERIAGSDVIILDCLRPCLDALGLDEHRDAGRFLVAWDSFKREAGVSESIVVHHMGHGQERSRGDSRLLDWPDVNWKIVKESQSEESDTDDAAGGRRFFSAHGRDVKVAEGMLHWDSETRALTYQEGGRREAKAVDAVDSIRTILSDPQFIGGMGTVELTRKLAEENIGKTIARRSIKYAIDKSIIIECSGARNAKILTLNPSEAM